MGAKEVLSLNVVIK